MNLLKRGGRVKCARAGHVWLRKFANGCGCHWLHGELERQPAPLNTPEPKPAAAEPASGYASGHIARASKSKTCQRVVGFPRSHAGPVLWSLRLKPLPGHPYGRATALRPSGAPCYSIQFVRCRIQRTFNGHSTEFSLLHGEAEAAPERVSRHAGGLVRLACAVRHLG